MLTNKRRPRKSQLYSVEACRVNIIIESLKAQGLGWENICTQLRKRFKIQNIDEQDVRKKVLRLK